MTTVLIVIHLMVVVAMVGLVLLQRSEGGALGIGGGSGSFMTGRGAANVLTRSTGILAAAFFVTSIALAVLSRLETSPSDIFRNLPGQTAPVTEGAPTEPATIPSGGGTAEEMLQQLEGAGPQTPPAEGGASEGTDTGSPDASAPDTSAPDTGSEAPAAQDGAAPQTPPAQDGAQQRLSPESHLRD
jgi:preprotein translocase subunit SecG